MDSGIVEKVIDEAFDVMYSPSMVAQLTGKDIDDYDRGYIAGQIAMLNKIARELANVDPEKIFEPNK